MSCVTQAVTQKDCDAIAAECEARPGLVFAVCHVLRYTPVNQLIHQLVANGALGELVHIQHMEPVGFYHFAHSFVRGNWRKTAESSFSLMAKSCHDLDLIRFWAGGRACNRVSSFGSLQHFRAANRPRSHAQTHLLQAEAARCVSCDVEDSCPYSAKKIYLASVEHGHTGWPVSVICDEPSVASVQAALESGPYGRCVYTCDNDVVDHQVVNFEFEGGVTAAFTMIAFSEEICQRKTKIFGSRGELTCEDSNSVSVFDFVARSTTRYECAPPPSGTRLLGHGGADFFLMDAFVRAAAANDPSLVATGPADALASHSLVFAAEHARLERTVVELR